MPIQNINLKKRNFVVKIFQKAPKNAFFGFFQNFACRAEHFKKTGSFYCFGKTNWVDLLKKVDKIIPPPPPPPPPRKSYIHHWSFFLSDSFEKVGTASVSRIPEMRNDSRSLFSSNCWYASSDSKFLSWLRTILVAV